MPVAKFDAGNYKEGCRHFGFGENRAVVKDTCCCVRFGPTYWSEKSWVQTESGWVILCAVHNPPPPLFLRPSCVSEKGWREWKGRKSKMRALKLRIDVNWERELKRRKTRTGSTIVTSSFIRTLKIHDWSATTLVPCGL